MLDTNTYYNQLEECRDFLVQQKDGFVPDLAIVCGSGLQQIAEIFDEPLTVSYADIPHFPVSGVSGHEGKLILGELAGVKVAVLQGRSHFYEGKSLQEITLPVRVMNMWGAKTLLLTNAAGGVNETFEPGDIMIIHDHINMSGQNPLVGPNDSRLGVRFPDMSEVYTEELQEVLRNACEEVGVTYKEGVYTWMSGPVYETPAEVRMLQRLGIDAVGMSTVPEAIAFRHMGGNIAGLSLITNKGAGLSEGEIDHSHVVEVGAQAAKKIQEIIALAIPQLV